MPRRAGADVQANCIPLLVGVQAERGCGCSVPGAALTSLLSSAASFCFPHWSCLHLGNPSRDHSLTELAQRQEGGVMILGGSPEIRVLHLQTIASVTCVDHLWEKKTAALSSSGIYRHAGMGYAWWIYHVCGNLPGCWSWWATHEAALLLGREVLGIIEP